MKFTFVTGIIVLNQRNLRTWFNNIRIMIHINKLTLNYIW
jgi:hypothetical protein